MKYLLFCCTEENKLNTMSGSEMDAIMEETLVYIEELRKSGRYLASERLQPGDAINRFKTLRQTGTQR